MQIQKNAGFSLLTTCPAAILVSARASWGFFLGLTINLQSRGDVEQPGAVIRVQCTVCSLKQCCGSEAINFVSGSRSKLTGHCGSGSYLPGHYGSGSGSYLPGHYRSGSHSYIFREFFARFLLLRSNCKNKSSVLVKS